MIELLYTYLTGCILTISVTTTQIYFSNWILGDVVRGSKQTELKIFARKLKDASFTNLKRFYLWPVWVIRILKGALFKKEELIE